MRSTVCTGVVRRFGLDIRIRSCAPCAQKNRPEVYPQWEVVEIQSPKTGLLAYVGQSGLASGALVGPTECANATLQTSVTLATHSPNQKGQGQHASLQ